MPAAADRTGFASAFGAQRITDRLPDPLASGRRVEGFHPERCERIVWLALGWRKSPECGTPTVLELRDQLISLVPSGETRAAAVAQRLNMSPRSFTRQLAKEGTTFGEILERLRRRLATRYLSHDRMSIKQIAWLLGYSEPGAFTHAYKRWTGTTPKRARQKQPPGLA